MKKLFLILLLSSIFYTNAQEINCTAIKDKEPEMFQNPSRQTLDRFNKILIKCAQLDSIDLQIFNTDLLGFLTINEKSLAYNNIFNVIKKYKKTSEYARVRELLMLSESLKNKIIRKDQWKTDKITLQKLGMKGDNLHDFETFIKRYKDGTVTYEKAIDEFKKFQASKEAQMPKEEIHFNEFSSYQEALNRAKKENKNLLLYFTGYTVPASMNMEEKVLNKRNVIHTINTQYTPYILVVDSREKLKEKYISKLTGKEITTVGAQASELESEMFHKNTQPFFVIIHPDGKVLKTTGYTTDVNKFLDFLQSNF